MATAATSVPLKILAEAVGSIVTIELDCGETFRGTLTSVDDLMNVTLENASHTRRGEMRDIPSTHIRGASIVTFQLPELLKLSPAVAAAAIAQPMPSRGRGNGFGQPGRGGGFGAGAPQRGAAKRQRVE